MGPRLGVTGTRRRLSSAQHIKLARFIEAYEPSELHHGQCVGADESAHQAAMIWNVPIVIHPPNTLGYAFDLNDYVDYEELILRVEEPKRYQDRNLDIVLASDFVVGFPEGPEDAFPRSGTWMAIRMARRQHNLAGVVMPDGSVTR